MEDLETLTFFEKGNEEETKFEATMTLEEAMKLLKKKANEEGGTWTANNRTCSLTESSDAFKEFKNEFNRMLKN